MGLISNFKTARLALTRRKIKNLSAILAITLGVTLMVGIQITTATLENSFSTGLLITEGEVDIRISNATGNYLTFIDKDYISSLVPDAAVAVELETNIKGQIGPQYEPRIKLSGIELNYSERFGVFEDWKTGEKLNLESLLTNNKTILLSSSLAEKMDITPETQLPLTLLTRFNNQTYNSFLNLTLTVEQNVNLTIVGIYNSNRPGIASQYRGALMGIEYLHDWMTLGDLSLNHNIVNNYLISFKSDHFNKEIDRDFLQAKYDVLESAIDTQVYTLDSQRLTLFQIIDLIFTILSAMLNVLGLMIVITGILLITNVQLMSVEDREFQTGVLRAVGENRRGIFQSILIETIFQGILGGILGLIGGIFFGQFVALYLADLFGTGQFSVQPVIQDNVIIFAVLVGVFIGILTGILPALRASRVNIVVALRGIKVAFEEKSGKNLAFLGIIFSAIGIYFLLSNGIIIKDFDYIWTQAGWNSLKEWFNILLGAGFLFSGLGIILSKYIDRKKAINLTAIVLWGTPTFMFIVAFDGWISSFSGTMELLLIAIIEIMIGSILLVGINLSPLMRFLRRVLIGLRGAKGIAQISPALISSHKTRSSLTFAIFAVVLTLNVVVASLVATNVDSTLGKAEVDSRGVDIVVTLSDYEKNVTGVSYTDELYKLDSSITDVISFKTFHPVNPLQFVTLKDPTKGPLNFTDYLPIGIGELSPEQIKGTAKNASEDNWRYDFALSSFPDSIRENYKIDLSDEEVRDLSRQAYDLYFDPSYKMTAYNISFSFGSFDFNDVSSGGSGGPGGFGSGRNTIDEAELRDENNTIIKNPIVFTDSFILPLGMQIWIPMNISQFGFPNYQAFTIGGRFDFQSGGGWPFSISFADADFTNIDFSASLGTLYIPHRYSQYTSFFGNAGENIGIPRGEDAYDSFLIKTSYPINEPSIEGIAQKIEEFTNTIDSGYRALINDNFIVATAESLYSRISSTIEIANQFTSFLQIYVSFGLVIGAVGMAIISVRNVAERKREIGMMRAIGFPRYQVMLSALLELVVLGLIGLFIGIFNGLILNIGFAHLQNVPVVIPWTTLGIYLSFITFVALLAGAIPGYLASKIPAAEALRYVG